MGARAGDGVAIGGEDAVVFDFSPQLDAGAEILSRRGEDQRFETKRPAAQRRRTKDLEYHLGRADEDEWDELGGPSTGSGGVSTGSGHGTGEDG
jgi:GTP-binding protein